MNETTHAYTNYSCDQYDVLSIFYEPCEHNKVVKVCNQHYTGSNLDCGQCFSYIFPKIMHGTSGYDVPKNRTKSNELYTRCVNS